MIGGFQVGVFQDNFQQVAIAIVESLRGGGGKRRKRKYPRKWSDVSPELQTAFVPVVPEIITAEIITVPARPFLSEALQDRESRKKRLRKVAAIAAAFLDG